MQNSDDVTVSDGNRRPIGRRSPTLRSRITNGKDVLPTAHGNSVWARLLRDTMEALYAHLGGEDHVSNPQRFAIRRIATFEVELIHLEDKFAGIRHAGGAPDMADLDLYGKLANAQRRFCEALGWTSVPKDVTPELRVYLATKLAAEPTGAISEPGSGDSS